MPNPYTCAILRGVALLFVGLFLVSSCAGQEVEGVGKNGPAVFSSAAFLEVTTPVTDRLGVNLFGFYLGNVEASIAMVEVPVKVQKYITITPAYLWIGVTPTGLSLAEGLPASSSYRENQFRPSASFTIPVHHFIVSDRNMYVDRYTPAGQVNRYRNRIYVAHPISLGRYKANAFAYDEIFHDFLPGNWLRRNWAAAGFELPLNRYVTLEPFYLRHYDSLLRSINFLALGVIVKTGKLFDRSKTNAGN